MVDVPGNSSTASVVTVGSTTAGTLETVGDHDWYRIDLTAGESITVTINGVTLEDPYLRVRSAAGTLLYENDDITSGINRNSQLAFTANYTGTYYIDVGAWNEGYAGVYNVVVSTYTPPPLYTNDQIAYQLTNGYWGGDDQHFNVTQGGTLTVNLTALTPGGQSLARQALALWSDIIGVTFQEVTSGGQIQFDDNEEGAFADSVQNSSGFTISSHVNVSTQWLSNYGTSLDSYSFQTYIHEIGHALGLGHAGNYNGSARYPFDALFENDSWAATVMSYFDQTENTYFGGQGFTEDFLATPMVADIIAMANLYGLSTTTRTGNTTYGYNSTANRDVYNATLYPDVVYTVFDSGGTDTLDYSGYSGTQRINLNSESFSNVLGNVGNVSIARGTIIENAIGGSGSDTIIGNAANNLLDGRNGVDTVSYASAASGVTVDLRLTTAQNTFGAGSDTLLNVENLIGSAFADTLIGNTFANVLDGGGGDDRIDGGTGADTMIGGAGNDIYYVDSSADIASEAAGEGVDWAVATASYVLPDNVDHLVLTGTAPLSGTGNALGNTLIGNDGANTLSGGGGSDAISGGAGNDTLHGGADSDYLDGGTGADTMVGGTGNDVYYVDNSADTATEAAGEGTDWVIGWANYTLSDNVEHLAFIGNDPVNGTGNGLDNTLIGNDGANTLSGAGGRDAISGGAGDDFLYGGADSDYLNGGSGTDTMVGGAGDEIYYVDSSADIVTEAAGEGLDWIVATASYVMSDNVEHMVLTGTASINGTGNGLSNSLIGNDGANILNGQGGNDAINGGAGNDRLNGGSGNDDLVGGSGADRFVFDGTPGNDIVYDFATGTDKIDLTAFGITSANVASSSENGNIILAVDANKDGTADFTITLLGVGSPAASDYLF